MFVQVKKEWGLSEWYPSLRNASKARPAEKDAEADTDSARDLPSEVVNEEEADAESSWEANTPADEIPF